MSRRHAEAMAKAHGTSIPGDDAPSEQGRTASAKPKKDLEDPAVQERIFDPDTKTITFNDGYKLTLNEPSLFARKRIFGFCMRVVSDGLSLPGINKGLLPLRLVSLLNARADLESEMHFWAGKLCGPAGTVSDDQAKQFAAEIEAHADPRDLSIEFQALCVLSGTEFPKN